MKRVDPLCIGGGALLSVALMSHHPIAHGADFAQVLQSLVKIAPLSAWIHGGMLAALFLILVGLQGLVELLPRERRMPRCAWLLFAMGSISFGAAAIVNGFVVSRLAERYVEQPPSAHERIRPVFHLCHEVNQSLAEVGTMACALSVGMFSLVLWQCLPRVRLLAVVGLAFAVVACLGLLSGHLSLHWHGMTAIVIGQALWLVALAVSWRRCVRSASALSRG